MAMPNVERRNAPSNRTSAISRSASAARCSVMSVATVMAPTTAPTSSNSGETLRITFASVASLRRRTVSRRSTPAPARTRCMIVASSARRSSGTSMDTCRPIASSAV